MDTIHRLATDILALEKAWECAPLVSTGLDDFSDVFSVAITERLIHSGMPLTAIQIVRNGTALSLDDIAAKHPNPDGEAYADGTSLIGHIIDGVTIMLEYLEVYCPEVAKFVAILERDIGYSMNCAAFVTAAGSRGAAPHYDMVSIFLKQIFGSKRWRVYAPIQRLPTEQWRPSLCSDTEQILDVVLKEGDCLYVPRGFIHVGDAAEEGSIHLTIGMTPRTWADVLRLTIEAAAKSEELREAIPPRFMHTDEERFFRGKLAQLQMPAMDSLRPQSASNAVDNLFSALRGRAALQVASS